MKARPRVPGPTSKELRAMPSPRVTPFAVIDNGDTRVVHIHCPYCPKDHTHAWPYGAREVGHRPAHCGNAGSELYYYILRPTTQPTRQEGTA